MKTTRYQLIHRIMWFATIISTICCIGCFDTIDKILGETGESEDDVEWVISYMPIVEIDVLVAEGDPAQVSVKVFGYLPDGCTTYHETRQTREGNTVNIRMTTKRPKDSVICTKVVTEIRERISIGTFPRGDYAVIVNGVEQKFRID